MPLATLTRMKSERLYLIRSRINSAMFLTLGGEMFALVMCGPGGKRLKTYKTRAAAERNPRVLNGAASVIEIAA